MTYFKLALFFLTLVYLRRKGQKKAPTTKEGYISFRWKSYILDSIKYCSCYFSVPLGRPTVLVMAKSIGE